MKRNDSKDARSLVRNDGTYAHDASADYASVVKSGCVAGNSSINTAKETMNQTSPAVILVSTAARDQVTNPCVRESRAERKRKLREEQNRLIATLDSLLPEEARKKVFKGAVSLNFARTHLFAIIRLSQLCIIDVAHF